MTPAAQLTLDQVAAAIGELTRSVAAIQSYLAGVPPPLPPPPQPAATTLPAVLPYGMPYSSTTGVPIHLLRMPPSPSPIPSWALASTTSPVYTMATSPAATSVLPPPTTAVVVFHGGPQADGFFYGGSDGPLFYGPGHLGVSASPSTGSVPEPFVQGAHGAPQGAHPPRFYKLEFTTYDGSEDPLNWLNHCEQFFRGQCTLASDRT